MKKTRETDLVAACLQLLRLCNIHCWRNNVGVAKFGKRLVRFSTPGAPDIMAVLPGGQFFCVEAKVGRNAPTPAQAHFLDTVRTAGGAALVVRDVAELQAWLADAGLWKE